MDSTGTAQIISALEVIYSSKSDNNQRLVAQKFLDQVKNHEESPFWGYDIALNNSGNPILKYFGLGLLVGALQRHWKGYDAEKQTALRKWIIDLNYRVTGDDPRYIKEKLAFLWVEVAKRIWGEALKETAVSDESLADSWVDMDRNLVELWHLNEASRELVLIIFRVLFEDSFLLEDLTVLKRISIVQPLCIMIVCPMNLFSEHYKHSEKWSLFKSNNEGWFGVWVNELHQALDSNNEQYIMRLLETLKTCLNWPISEIIMRYDIFGALLKCLLSKIPKAQAIALDSIHILSTRPYHSQSQYDYFFNKVFESMDVLDKVYDDLQFNPVDGVDEAKYPIIKKFADMITCLHKSILKFDTDNINAKTYLRLVLKTTYNPSLIVSGISLDLWCACLRNDDFLPYLEKLVLPDLLEFSANALIHYEQIEDHISKVYADVDFQSIADYNNFCSTYRKRIRDVIRLISCVQMDYVYCWLCSRLNNYFSSSYGQEVLGSTFLNHKAEPYWSSLSQLMIVECFINGCIRWKIWYTNEEDYNEKLDTILAKIETLSNQLISLNLKDPLLLKKQIQNLALFLTILKDNVLFTLLEKIITSATMTYPDINIEEKSEKSDAVRELRYACGIELNRMALLMPDSLKNIYSDLENVVANILPKLNSHETISFKSFLLSIALSSSINDKDEKFFAIVDPELAAWSDKSTVVGLTDLPWFLERLGIVKIAEYFQKRGINEDSDLLAIQIDEEGKQLKVDLTKHWQTLFPVRATRMFIHYSMQTVKTDEDFKKLQELWKPRVVPILPYILRLLYQLQSYHNPSNWKDLPTVVQSFVKYSTIERFWEAGATNKSKDEFIDEHMKALQTVRDFADSVGHIVRYTREYVLLILSGISSLGSVFYEIEDLPNLLINSVAIYEPGSNEISPGVSTHGWKHIINVAIRPILKGCPAENAPTFMSAFLPKLFDTIYIILSQKWSAHANNSNLESAPVDDDEMTEEILEENLLRQLTTVVVRLLIDCVGQLGVTAQTSKLKLNSHQVKMRRIIFGDVNTMASFLKLLNYLISCKDSKCSFNALLIIKSSLTETLLKNEEIDRFYVTEILPNFLLNVLTQSAFKDSFHEAMYVFTVAFLTLCKERESCREYFYELSHGYDIESLYDSLRSVDNYKDQKVLMVDFIEWIKTINNDASQDVADDSKKQERRAAVLAKANERLVKKNKYQGDMLDDPNTEDGAFGHLFGDQ
ncbi:HCL376Wp [Eremothecium sinecaudum]|uniref:HCL376Wp n=1 Tax=Eremothecium sinecaudum TaxID=45286 RepID=A0A109UYD3_9SACH|nr:HCL376Wp [Eremothecium sinecaudum]AMD19775.1 HCL376Wp [Eremothecium sinecaudum]